MTTDPDRKPMSDEYLAAIRRAATESHVAFVNETLDLLAEVDRLRARPEIAPGPHVVYRRGVEPKCNYVEAAMPLSVTAWVGKPMGRPAFGRFMAACKSVEDAEAIAAALNAEVAPGTAGLDDAALIEFVACALYEQDEPRPNRRTLGLPPWSEAKESARNPLRGIVRDVLRALAAYRASLPVADAGEASKP